MFNIYVYYTEINVNLITDEKSNSMFTVYNFVFYSERSCIGSVSMLTGGFCVLIPIVVYFVMLVSVSIVFALKANNLTLT